MEEPTHCYSGEGLETCTHLSSRRMDGGTYGRSVVANLGKVLGAAGRGARRGARGRGGRGAASGAEAVKSNKPRRSINKGPTAITGR